MKTVSGKAKVWLKRLPLYLFDAAAVSFAYVFMNYIIYGDRTLFSTLMESMMDRSVFFIVAYLLVFKLFGLYNVIWKYAGVRELFRCASAAIFAGIVGVGIERIGSALRIAYMMDSRHLPQAIYVSATLLIIGLVGGSRMLYKLSLKKNKSVTTHEDKKAKRIMIVGAGEVGTMIIKELELESFRFGKPVVIVDDNTGKQGQRLRGIPVRGGCEKIPDIAKSFDVDEIILCMPSVASERQLEIIKIAMETDCVLKTAPSLLELVGDKAELKKIRNVEITDLLPRAEVTLDTKVCGYLTGQTVLVTGGGGSIGSELCRQVAVYNPARIVIFDNYENNAFTLKNQLDNIYAGVPEVSIRIGSVQDEARLREVFAEFKPTVVFHAAAHKHVPLMEDSPCEAIKNNVFGTYNTARVAMESGVKKFILLSTDKAVNPANVMGASKRVTELVIQHFDRHTTGTRFAAVRFGNVLGSNGSVIPIFKEQIARGGPVTVTDKDITRYFMTIPEAAQLVVQAGGIANGGEVFVLDMGEPVKILSLAENLIRLSGYTPYVDIDIEFTGLRPGEKLYEELSLEEELAGRQMTANNQIFVAAPVDFDETLLIGTLEELRSVNNDNVRQIIKKMVPNYTESCSQSE